VSLIIKSIGNAVALSCLLLSISAPAAPVYPDNAAAITNPRNSLLADERNFTKPLLEASPVPADKPTSLPEFSDPLGMGVDDGLKVFDGYVGMMDLLTNPGVTNPDITAEIELPPGALRGIDILDDLESLYLFYNGRAFDSSVMELEGAKIVDRKGLPVTTDGSPISLTDFGIIDAGHKKY
jgi:hypothetical protein